jgi:hypothetical protein
MKNYWKIIKNSNKKHYVIAECTLCGNKYEVYEYNIKTNKSTKCYKCSAEQRSETTNLRTHGLSKKYRKLYNVWCGIKRRCYNKNQKSFKDYGARGIKMCDVWKNDFSKFCEWALKNGYKEGLEIDRIDNDGNYEPNNCRWITKKENISRIVHKYNVNAKWKETITKTGKTEDELDDIIEAATSGYFKAMELSELTGLDRHTILRLVRRCGLEPVWRKYKIKLDEIKKIKETYKENEHRSNESFCVEMAKKFNSNRETIRQIIKDIV